MNSAEYKAVLSSALKQFTEANRERDKIDLEIVKLRQFIMAAINMLSEEERGQFLEVMREIGARAQIRDANLKDAILGILRAVYPNYLTAAGVRDRLEVNAFDFSEYTSNPLASVSTTLRRFKPTEVETTTIEGVNAYRLKKRPLGMIPRKGQFGDRKPVTEET